MSALSDLINQELERRGWSGYSLRTLSTMTDNKVSKDTVRIYRAGTHGIADELTLSAWSDLLKVPVTELREAAGVPAGQTGPYVPPAESGRLSQRARAALDELIRTIASMERNSYEEAPQPLEGPRHPEGTGAGERGPTPIASIERAKRRLQRVTSEGELLPGAASSEHGVTDGAIREIDKIARAARERHTRGLAEPVDGPDQPD